MTKVTAKTLTDEMIRELRAETEHIAVGHHVAGLAALALGEGKEARIVLALKPQRSRQARAKLAEILNARAGR